MITHNEMLFGLVMLALVSSALLILNLLALRQSRRLLGQLTQLQATAPEAATADVRYQTTDIPTSMLVTTLSRLERRIMQLEDLLGAGTPPPKAAPGPAPITADVDVRYERAQQLVGEADSAEQLSEASGLTLYEAELLLRIHRRP